jgi:hypothetical protein
MSTTDPRAKITLTPANIASIEAMGWKFMPKEWQWMKFDADDKRTAIQGDETWAANLLDAGVAPDGFDFVIPAGPARIAIQEFWVDIHGAESACGQQMIEAGMEPAHAMMAMVDSLIKRAAALACATATAYLGRDPDPAKWRDATDKVFALAAEGAKKVFAEHAEAFDAAREADS